MEQHFQGGGGGKGVLSSTGVRGLYQVTLLGSPKEFWSNYCRYIVHCHIPTRLTCQDAFSGHFEHKLLVAVFVPEGCLVHISSDAFSYM